MQQIITNRPIRFTLIILFTAIVLGISAGNLSAQTTEIDYKTAIEKADKYFTEKDYINAKAYYQIASKKDPGSEYPKEQLQKTMQLLRQQMKLSGQYTMVISKADQLLEERKYDEAIAEYKKALDILPGKKYPKEKIEEIEITKLEQKQNLEAYQKAMKEGDELYTAGQYEDAKLAFEKAVAIFPEDDVPGEKINEINNILYELEQSGNKYDMAISNAEFFMLKKDLKSALAEYRIANEIKPYEKIPAEKIKEIETTLNTREKFNGLIEEADRLYIVKDYRNARTQYQEAQKIKPTDTYIAEMINKIDVAIAKKATTEQEDYDNAITRGNEFMNTKEYKLAKSQFEFASRLKPSEVYPKTRVEEIDAVLLQYDQLIEAADKHFAEEDYVQAKQKYSEALELLASEQYPQEKLDETETILSGLARKMEKDASYNSVLAQADSLLASNRYAEAKIKYQESLEIKSTEAYPKEKIDEVNRIMTRLFREKETREKFQNLIAEGDRLFGIKEYDKARQKYAEAVKVLPEVEYASLKISEIEQIQADLAAYKAKRNDYEKLLEEADNFFSGKDYPNAREKYTMALEVFATESYPQERISEIDTLVANIARQKEIQEKYDAAIAEADKLLEQKNYTEAKRYYLQAVQQKPDDEYASRKTKEVEAILLEIEREKRREELYAASLSAGDSLLALNQYQESKLAFQEALSLKPGESYPADKITEIDRELDRLEKERLQAYELAITKGDNFFEQKNYKSAKESYVSANKLFPEKAHPIDRIDACNVQLSIMEKEAQQAYDQAIANADKFYNSKIYDKAIEAYSNAIELKPSEDYPYEMINKITELINRNILVDINTETVIVESNKERKFNFPPIDMKERKNNYILVKAKNMSGKEFKMIMNYGKGGVKNGGTILRFPNTAEEKDFIIRIGTQYKWFSEDNDWVSIYPEGGEVEVSLIRVSKTE